MSHNEARTEGIFGRGIPNCMSACHLRHGDAVAAVGLVHDLGNLLQVASSALSIISRDHSVGSSPVLAPLIDSAKTALHRAGALTRQAILLAGQSTDAIEQVDVAACLGEIELMLRNTWPSTIRFEFSNDDALMPVQCSATGLQNTIMNLALNALDAMPHGGTLSIGARAIPKTDLPRQIELRVTDTGLGMTPETVARAFEPFFTTKTDGLGGLGLPMVRRFAHESGGQVQIVSRPGVGTSVSLRLPVSEAASEAQAIRHSALSQTVRHSPPLQSASALPTN